MVVPWLSSWLSSWRHHGYWDEFSLQGISIEVKTPSNAFPGNPTGIPPYFWGSDSRSQGSFLIYTGYSEARDLIGNGAVADIRRLSIQAQDLVAEIFRHVEDTEVTSSDRATLPTNLDLGPTVVQLRLSSGLERWREAQHAIGNILPPKGTGLSQASEKALRLFEATSWPEALKTNNTLFGCGIADLLMGAADAPTMLSNYVTDMVFYWEHGYDHIFPSLEVLLQRALLDRKARRTLGGSERRDSVTIGRQYIQGKISLEKQHKTQLMNKSARMSRCAAQIVSLSESSLLGMAAEAIARGFDPGAIMSDLVFSSPGTDVIDVGSDLLNSEIMNSFLNTADVTDTGIVSEEALRRVYDAHAATAARMLTQRWHEPVARMCALLYTWHIQNDRHMFLRRAILGWPKARKKPAWPQHEADFDEVFDKQYHTTGIWRAIDHEYACNGEETCNRVSHLLNSSQEEPLLRGLWWFLVVRPLEYVRGGQINEGHEKYIVECSRLRLAEVYSRGLVLETAWLVAHANHHAWQVNYLFEAAMFGSLLDGGQLAGKLDRKEES